MDSININNLKLFCIIVIFGGIVYLAYNKTIDGFETKSGSSVKDIVAGIKNANGKLTDILNISKYKSDYDAMVTNHEIVLNNSIIQLLLQVDSSQDASSGSNLKVYEQINILTSSKNALPNVLQFIQKS
jgi:hypothetical protein